MACSALSQHRVPPVSPPTSASTARAASPQLDAICAQKDAHTALLYWFTDLGAAIAEAQRTSEADPVAAPARPPRRGAVVREQPVLPQAALPRSARSTSCCASGSSCTGSRVRPVPKVTIDFGDGRRIERTLTGNSAHLVLDRDGRPVDALPGLFSRRGVRAAARARARDRDCRSPQLAAHAQRELERPVSRAGAPSPRSVRASMIATTKHMVEMPMLARRPSMDVDADTRDEPRAARAAFTRRSRPARSGRARRVRRAGCTRAVPDAARRSGARPRRARSVRAVRRTGWASCAVMGSDPISAHGQVAQ